MPHSLLITRNLPPLRGGMERLNLQLARELCKDGGLDVIGPVGCRLVLPAKVAVSECMLKPLPRFLLAATFAALNAVVRRRPTFVIAGSGLSAPIAWICARLSGAQAAVYLHGLDLVADSRVYRSAWLPFIRRCDVCIVNSHNTAELARSAGVRAESIQVVHPGVDLRSCPPAPPVVESFRQEKGWAGRRVLLSVGRLTERKGLADFVENVLPGLVSTYPDVLLAVIGNDAPDALLKTKRSVRALIEERVGVLGLEHHVRFYGEVDEDDLACAYTAAHLAIFPVRDVPGDVEGFGMVAVEAASYGLPTIAYAVGGVPDAVSHGVSGLLVKTGDHAAFAAAVSRALDAGPASFRDGCLEFASRFDWKLFGERIRVIAGNENGA